jgi:hypothetical protein
MIRPLFWTLAAAALLCAPGIGSDLWRIERAPGAVSIHSGGGAKVLTYLTQKPEGSSLTANSACCIYPLLTPAGKSVVALGPEDHPHHRGIFFAWYRVEGEARGDFWGWGAHAPLDGRKIVNRKIEADSISAGEARLIIENEWRAEGTVLFEERTLLTAREVPAGRWVEFSISLSAKSETRVPRAAFSGFCAKAVIGTDSLLTSAGAAANPPAPSHEDPATAWPDAAWYDFSTTLADGSRAGIAVFNHPANPPTRWHNLASIGMVNPCVLADGDIVVQPGKPLVLRYGVLAHDGPAPAAALDQLARDWRNAP